MIAQCFHLAALLLDGKPLSRKVITQVLGTTPGNAGRYLRAIIATMPVLVREHRGTKVVQVRRTSGSRSLPNATAVAACIAASLARVFQATPLGHRMNDAVANLLAASPNAERFDERERQYLFIARGGERALHKKGCARLDTIIDAILERKKLRLRYRRFSGNKQETLLKPFSLALHEHQLYIIGHSKSGLETIRFSRVHAAMKMREGFKYPETSEYDPRKVFRDSLGIFTKDDAAEGIRVCKVKIRLSKKWLSYVKSHRWHHSQQHRLDEQGVILELRLRTCLELERMILGFGPDAEVLEPRDLRDKIAKQVQATAARYSRK